MIISKIIKLILATFIIINFCLNTIASEEIKLRGKGGKIKKSGGIVKIKASSNMMKIEKFKKTFEDYYSHVEKEKISVFPFQKSLVE